jgi:hypothetical protein
LLFKNQLLPHPDRSDDPIQWSAIFPRISVRNHAVDCRYDMIPE